MDSHFSGGGDEFFLHTIGFIWRTGQPRRGHADRLQDHVIITPTTAHDIAQGMEARRRIRRDRYDQMSSIIRFWAVNWR